MSILEQVFIIIGLFLLGLKIFYLILGLTEGDTKQ